MLAEVKTTVLIYEQHKQEVVTILFVCSTGTHKSVAGSRLCKESFGMAGYHTHVTHLSAEKWASRKKCSTCGNCNVDSYYKKEVYEHCYKMWKNI